MRCPKCQAENREKAKFCVECGEPFRIACPKCGNTVHPDGKFCDECGQPLSTAPKSVPLVGPLQKLRRYLPTGLAEKILAQRDKTEGERRQVTVLFCDLEGFTPLTEKLGPEEAYALMDRVYEILIHKVHDFEGTVNEMTGDGVMALFGAPIALEDAPQRAIRSALSIHREMARLSERLRTPSPSPSREGRGDGRDVPPLRMRVGIHTGPVVVGTLGNDLRVEFKAVGDTVNLASRMQTLAEPGTTYVTADTFKLTEGLFRFEGLGKKEIKGKTEAVEVYRVLAPSTRRTRFDVNAERGLTPFVGRERELELLLDAWERARGGRGQAVSIVADAGVGKSRLLYEFRKRIANEDATFLEGKCLSFSRGVAYHPVADLLKANFDLREGEGDPDVTDKVRKGLTLLRVDETNTLPYLLEILSVPESGIDQIQLSPEGKRDQTLQALTRIVLKGSELRPLILSVEDLHWIDQSSEDALKELLEHIAGARVLLLFTYRTEYVHTWGARSYHSQVRLNRLSNRETLAMVTHLLGTESVAEDLLTLVLEKTEGVPFFVEEFLKSLQDLQIIRRQDTVYALTRDPKDVTIPSTIQDVILARVDALPEGAKEVLQAGSVIEREFPYALIQKVTNLPEKDLLTRLSHLKDAELLYERGIYPESVYVFKHALTREVVYGSILAKKRKELHRTVGETMEQTYAGNLAEHLGTLCDHFVAGENYEKGANYAKLAARKAEKTVSLLESIEYGKKRVTCAEKLPTNKALDRPIIDARVTLGLYLAQMGHMTEAKAVVELVVDRARKPSYERRLGQIYTIIGAYSYFIEEDYESAFRYLREAIRISDEVEDKIGQILSHLWYGNALMQQGDFAEALRQISTAYDINASVRNLWGMCAMKSYLSVCHIYASRIAAGHQSSTEAMSIAETSRDVMSKGQAHTSHGISWFYKGHLEAAKGHLVLGADLCDRARNLAWAGMSHWYLGECHRLLGEHASAAHHFEKAARSFEQEHVWPSIVRYCRACGLRSNTILGQGAPDLKGLTKVFDRNRIRSMEAYAARVIAEVFAYESSGRHWAEAERWLNKGLEIDARNHAHWGTAQDYVLYAELHKKRGDLPRVREALGNAIEKFTECGADGWVTISEEALSKVY